MKVILSENKIVPLMLNEMLSEYEISDGNAFHNPYKKRLDKGKEQLKKLVDNYGQVMTSIENGRDYVVYELYALSQLLSIRYCLCRVVSNKTLKPSGAVLIKSLDTFKVKNY